MLRNQNTKGTLSWQETRKVKACSWLTPHRNKPTLWAVGIKPRVLHMLQTKQLLHHKTVSLAIFLLYCFISKKYLAKLSRLALNSLCNQGRPWTWGLLAQASWVTRIIDLHQQAQHESTPRSHYQKKNVNPFKSLEPSWPSFFTLNPLLKGSTALLVQYWGPIFQHANLWETSHGCESRHSSRFL